MKKLIHEIIELLRAQVKKNLEVINYNEEIIRKLSSHPESAHSMETYQKHYTENKSLITENNDFANLQLTLMNFLKKYKHSALLNDKFSLDEVNLKDDPEYVFELTISGKIPYNSSHPFFESHDFFCQLLEHFQRTEQYEKCHELIELKKKKEKAS
jgi:hypothetical protein